MEISMQVEQLDDHNNATEPPGLPKVLNTTTFQGKSEWRIEVSDMAKRTMNPIRRAMSGMKMVPNEKYSVISLSIGDPTVFGNLLPHENMLVAVENSLRSHRNNGYLPAIGSIEARRAIASFMNHPDAPLTENDVIIASGCSGAIELCINALTNPGDNIIIGCPTFSLYRTIAVSNGVEVKEYNLLPENEWEADIEQLKSLIDEKTRCIFVNNPSNPCGSVYSKEHLMEILKVADEYKVPIVADEIYAYSVFPGEEFHPMATLTKTVPILSVCAISKRFLVPGWRLGWIQIHDRNNRLDEVRQGLRDLCTRILGASSVIQGAIPKLLMDTPTEWFHENVSSIQECAVLSYNSLSQIPGLKPVRPRGAMYMMVGIDTKILQSVSDDVSFAENLMAKKSVFCLPGSIFSCPGFFRIVLTVPKAIMQEACERVKDYCEELVKNDAVVVEPSC